MINIQTKNRILALYKEGNSAYERLKQDEYQQLYFAVRPYISLKEIGWQNAVSRFLLYGAKAFDRFMGPLRPQYVDEESYDMFCNFLSSVRSIWGDTQYPTCTLTLDKLWWDVFRECNLMPYDEEMESFLTQCGHDVQAVVVHETDANLVQDVEKKKSLLFGLIKDIREGIIRTKIHTSLPFSFSDSDANVQLQVDGVNVRVKICNQSQGCSLPGTKIAEGSTMTTSGPSSWTTTSCELDIEADCLMDGLELKPKATLQREEDDRFWTAAFDFTYRVVTALWMFFQEQDNRSASWPPLPNDIHYLDYRVVAEDRNYDNEYTTNPALVYHVRSLKKPVQEYSIDDEDARWSSYTYRFAKVYAESGQLKEAIFWLNVSVESLVEEFVRKIATTKEIRNQIEGEVHKFDTAEEILVEQFPEMKGKVKWPDTVIHTSVFTKLKRAVQMTPIAHLQKDIIKKYSLVNTKRNDLFHGDNVTITVVDVEKAFSAYEWLKGKLSCQV